MKTKLWLLRFLIFIALLVPSMPVLAQNGVGITLTPDKSKLTVGDTLHLTLEVKHPTGYQVIMPTLRVGQSWGDFEVHAQSQAETVSNPDGTETTRQTIEATLFSPGDFQTPPLTLTIRDNAGQISEETAPPVSITVTPVLAEEDDTLLDIKPQAELAVPPLWPWVVAGAAGIALLALAVWWLVRRLWPKRQFDPTLVVDTRPPYQVAFDQLAHIESLKLPEQGEFKEHYTLVTDCLRRYLEKQHHVRAFDRTTTELKASFKRSALLPDYTRRFLNLFSESDMVKFAKFIPDVEHACQLTTQAHLLVDETRPIPELESITAEEPSLNGKAAAAALGEPEVSLSGHDLDSRKDGRQAQ